LSYAQQVEEYEYELNHISLQMIKVLVGRWVFSRRWGKTVGGEQWPRDAAWAEKKHLYHLAVDSIAATRLRSLITLLGECKRKSKPKMYDTVLPSLKPPLPGMRRDKQSGKERRGDRDFDEFDSEDFSTEPPPPEDTPTEQEVKVARQPVEITPHTAYRLTNVFCQQLGVAKAGEFTTVNKKGLVEGNNHANGKMTPKKKKELMDVATTTQILEQRLEALDSACISHSQLRNILQQLASVEIKGYSEWKSIRDTVDPNSRGKLTLPQFIDGMRLLGDTSLDTTGKGGLVDNPGDEYASDAEELEHDEEDIHSRLRSQLGDDV